MVMHNRGDNTGCPKEGDILLIWGFKGRYRDVGSGPFHCPQEGADRQYTLKRVQRWFTFFFIPIIPLKVLGEFVECNSCKSGYGQTVLTMPTAAAILDNLSNAMRHAVVAIIVADGRVEEFEKDAALEVMRNFADTPYTRQNLDEDLAKLQPSSLEDEMQNVAGALSAEGKERLLAACLAIAAADGSIDPSEVKEIERAGLALGMSPAHIRGVLADALADRS